ncbi:MAG: hypothetical protein ACJ739_17550 [Acidimicrobiales bacterium]
MAEVLRGLVIAGFVAWGVLLVGVLWVRHRVRRHLRILPARRSTAPTAWLVSPSGAARLHRRLRTVSCSARVASSLDPGLAAVADDLVGEVVALEPHVLAAARSGRAGGALRRDLSARISELEAVARRLTTLAGASAAHAGSSGPTRVRERLTALEAAREELADIDLRAGVLRHT